MVVSLVCQLGNRREWIDWNKNCGIGLFQYKWEGEGMNVGESGTYNVDGYVDGSGSMETECSCVLQVVLQQVTMATTEREDREREG